MCVIDGLLCLWHDSIIRCDNNHRDICDLRTTSSHCCKCLVTRCIKECHLASLWQCDVIRTNVLRNTTGLSCNDIGTSNKIQKRRLSMVNVPHDRDNWRAFGHVRLVIYLNFDGLLNVCTDKIGLVAEFFRDDCNGFRVQTLIDGDHNPQRHAGRNDLVDIGAHHVCQFRYRHKFGELQCFCILLLSSQLLFLSLLYSAALRTSQFR